MTNSWPFGPACNKPVTDAHGFGRDQFRNPFSVFIDSSISYYTQYTVTSRLGLEMSCDITRTGVICPERRCMQNYVQEYDTWLWIYYQCVCSIKRHKGIKSLLIFERIKPDPSKYQNIFIWQNVVIASVLRSGISRAFLWRSSGLEIMKYFAGILNGEEL